MFCVLKTNFSFHRCHFCEFRSFYTSHLQEEHQHENYRNLDFLISVFPNVLFSVNQIKYNAENYTKKEQETHSTKKIPVYQRRNQLQKHEPTSAMTEQPQQCQESNKTFLLDIVFDVRLMSQFLHTPQMEHLEVDVELLENAYISGKSTIRKWKSSQMLIGQVLLLTRDQLLSIVFTYKATW